MKITDIAYAPTYFDTYISQVGDLDIQDALNQSFEAIHALDLEKLRVIGDQVYAPGKWTIRELFQHITDTERVFAYRALRFARNDKTALPGFDENLFADNSRANSQSLDDILAELRCVRQSTLMLFKSMDETVFRRTGIMYNSEVPVLAVGFTLVGHQIHHLRILKERYFPILQTA